MIALDLSVFAGVLMQPVPAKPIAEPA